MRVILCICSICNVWDIWFIVNKEKGRVFLEFAAARGERCFKNNTWLVDV